MRYLIIATIIIAVTQNINCQGVSKNAVTDINYANKVNKRCNALTYRPIQSHQIKQVVSKNNNENLRKADSIIDMVWSNGSSQFGNNTKDEFEYDSKGNITVYVQSAWDYYQNKWDIETKFEFNYNDYNYLTQETRKYWNAALEVWIPYRKYIFELTVENKLTNEYWYDYDNYNNVWIKKWKTSYSYNDSLLLAKEHIYKWDTLTSDWLNSYKNELTYNGYQNLVFNIEEVWSNDSSDWVIVSKNEYFYNQANQLFFHIFSHRLNLFDPFGPYWKRDISYDSSGFLVLEYYEDWSIDLATWIPSRKDICSYYENSEIKTRIIDFYNNNQSFWYNYRNYEYVYDNNLNLIKWLNYFPVNDSTWSINSLTEFNYDYMNDEFIIPDFTDYPFDYYLVEYYDNITNEPIDYLSYYNVNDTLRNSHWTKYFFSNEYEAIEDSKSSKQIFAFPNPAYESIKLNILESDNIKNIRLYNQIGQIVFFKQQILGDLLDIRDVKPGLYMLEANINNTIITQKIIIR